MKFLIASSFVMGMSAIHAEGLGTGFLTARVGDAHYDLSQSAQPDGNRSFPSIYLGGGIRWGQFGIEAGYVDLGEAGRLGQSDGNCPHICASDPKVSLRGWTAGVTGRFSVSDRWSIGARAGTFYWNAIVRSNYWFGDSLPGLYAQNIVKRGGTDWYAGAEIGYDLSANATIGLDLTRYSASFDRSRLSANVVSLMGEYRFH